MSPHNSILLLLTLWTSLQDGQSVPLVKRPGEPSGDVVPGEPGGDVVPGEPGGDVVSHQRTRRCACSSRLDSECHYFCHLDIVWINTPSKMTLYGLGGPRGRRATARCVCVSPADRTCSSFCVHSAKIQTLESFTKRPQPYLLSVLRRLADGSHNIKDAVKRL